MSDFRLTSSASDFAEISAAWASGDDEARNRAIELVHRELQTIASHVLRGNQRAISLLTSDLVNEAVLKLLQSRDVKLNDRAHLLALSARVMRHVLIDAIRRKSAAKRHGGHVTLTTDAGPDNGPAVDVLALDRALRRLTAIDPGRASIVEMRYFAGMSIDEIALVLEVSPSTVKRSWTVARAWLREAIEDDVAG